MTGASSCAGFYDDNNLSRVVSITTSCRGLYRSQQVVAGPVDGRQPSVPSADSCRSPHPTSTICALAHTALYSDITIKAIPPEGAQPAAVAAPAHAGGWNRTFGCGLERVGRGGRSPHTGQTPSVRAQHPAEPAFARGRERDGSVRRRPDHRQQLRRTAYGVKRGVASGVAA